MQTVLQVGFKTFGVETAKQGFTGEIVAGAVQVGEFFAPPQGATGRGQTIDETETFGGADHPLIGTGQHG
ncbi:hypothetical protein D3C87_1804470 [compost metagenome]